MVGVKKGTYKEMLKEVKRGYKEKKKKRRRKKE
jgi:hypothetical protein